MKMKANAVKTRASPPVDRDHRRLPSTQDWLRWLRTVATKEDLSSEELSAKLQEFVAYDPDPQVANILYWLTKGILDGPVKGPDGYYYRIPSKKGKVMAYFFQNPKRPVPIAKKTRNLSPDGLYQDPKTKAVQIGLIVEKEGEVRKGYIAIEKGRIVCPYPITTMGLLELLPKSN